MNDVELRRCRAVHRALSARLRVIKAKLRTVVIEQAVLSGNNAAMLGWTKVERMRAFRYSLTAAIVQTLDNFIGGTCESELAAISEPLVMAMSICAEHAMMRHMTPTQAWKYLSDAFDVATKGEVAEFAVRVVLTRPTVALVKDAAPAQQQWMDEEWVFSA